ncbi:MAG: hypothetical protein AAB886_00655 [Patescibacteria group bacterium]
MTDGHKMFSEWFNLTAKKLPSRGARRVEGVIRAGWGGARSPQEPVPSWTPGENQDVALREAVMTTLLVNDAHFREREKQYLNPEVPSLRAGLKTALEGQPDGSVQLIDRAVEFLITIRDIRHITLSLDKDARIDEVKALMRRAIQLRLNLVYLKASHMIPVWGDDFIIAMIQYLEDGPVNTPSSASPA